MIQQILTISFYLLFGLTPLVWTSFNFELFEYNKMMLVYILTVIIIASWLWKMIQKKQLILARTPLDLPLLFFFLANLFSTIFSVDRHTSIWGYYSRSNGGLLSLTSYLILYYALVSNFTATASMKFLKAALLGGVVVSLWAIPEHFGISPSCVILNGQFNASCWIQDVQARVFATLGQPNWLAAYLAMLIFPAFYFLLTARSHLSLILNTLYLILFYLAFTFTYSRGATLGLVVGLLSFITLLLFPILRLHHLLHLRCVTVKPLLIALAVFLVINLLFGSALTDFKLLSEFSAPARPSVSLAKASGTQLESGGTESGAIRLIVWQGALEIFKHYPVLGSGVETFAYTYYNFRPKAHNLTSEWDFLYNKAHNEYLNYLATTGLVGFIPYLAIILTFLVWTAKRIQRQESSLKDNQLNSSFLLLTAILASYLSYLIQNFFSFSVVAIALSFYLFPALIFIATNSTTAFQFPKPLYFIPHTLYPILYRRPAYSKIARAIIITIATISILTFGKFWVADTYFAKGTHASETGNVGRAYNYLQQAVALNPGEPYFKSELGYAAAASAVSLAEEDATTSAKLKEEAILETRKALEESPKNLSFHRTAIRTFYLLSGLDKDFQVKTLREIDQSIALALTDPKLTFNKALILGQMGKNEEAAKLLEKTIELRPNYREAHLSLGSVYFELGRKDQAIVQVKAVLKLIPSDSEALEKLKEWEK